MTINTKEDFKGKCIELKDISRKKFDDVKNKFQKMADDDEEILEDLFWACKYEDLPMIWYLAKGEYSYYGKNGKYRETEGLVIPKVYFSDKELWSEYTQCLKGLQEISIEEFLKEGKQ